MFSKYGVRSSPAAVPPGAGSKRKKASVIFLRHATRKLLRPGTGALRPQVGFGF
jgi:hypothetical protein